MSSDIAKAAVSTSAQPRLVSLDALRGFDMFWIIGGEGIASAAAKLTGWGWLVWLAEQLHHPAWNGFTFYDLIFPLFLFIAGVAMPFSFDKRLERGDTKLDLYRHVIVRGLLLVFLGMIYNGLLQFTWPDMRLPSVLGRIGLAYLLAGLIVLNTNPRAQIGWIIGILLGYWAALRFIPIPEFGAHDLTPGHTLPDYIDRLLIPGKLYHGNRDPEGLMATIPAVATALFGAVTGHLLKNGKLSGQRKTATLVLVGCACLGLSYLWDFEFPINKNLWTSSFVLRCAGWSMLFLSLFYYMIDVRNCHGWAFPWIVIGSNSILIYMSARFIDYKYTADFFFGGALKHAGIYQPLLWATAIVLTKWLLLWFLYRRKIFLRV